jgi:hypothetical protein
MRVQGEHQAWLGSPTTRAISDIVLGCVSTVAGKAAIASAEGQPYVELERMSAWAFPALLGYGLAVVGAALMLRGCFVRSGEPGRWGVRAATAIMLAIVVVVLAAREWGSPFLLLFGPSEFVALIVLVLAIGTAIVRGSLLRTIAMALLGLLLATIGTEISSGSDRYTFGLEQLADGIPFPVLVLGLIFAADALLGLVSPSLTLATDARHVAGLANRVLTKPVTLSLRVLAAMMLAVVTYTADQQCHVRRLSAAGVRRGWRCLQAPRMEPAGDAAGFRAGAAPRGEHPPRLDDCPRGHRHVPALAVELDHAVAGVRRPGGGRVVVGLAHGAPEAPFRLREHCCRRKAAFAQM